MPIPRRRRRKPRPMRISTTTLPNCSHSGTGSGKPPLPRSARKYRKMGKSSARGFRIPSPARGADLVKALGVLGYERVRQEGSHIRLTTERQGQHHVTIPNHNPLKLGTLSGLLKAVAAHHGLTVEELLRRIRI